LSPLIKIAKPKKKSHSDDRLLRAVRHDGAAGWELFCAEFDPLIRSITKWPKWKFTKHEQQDVRQNIYVHLQTALPTFRRECSLAWFIKKIAMNKCIDEVRRQKRWRTVMTPITQQNGDGNWNEMEFETVDALDPHDEVIRKERRQLLHSAMKDMGKNCQETITLFYLKHCSYRQIADQLDISVNTVGSRLTKCLDKLHRELIQLPEFKRS
jgi:RNA polymerase sigma-70 factor (ECF subfamily)